MAPFGSWAGLPPEILLLISDGFGLSLESYCRVRGVCTAWRAALPPPITSLITVAIPPDAPPRHLIPDMPCAFHPAERPVQLSALFVPAGRSFHLATLPRRGQCVGSSNGWLAVYTRLLEIFLLNPLAGGKQIPLLPLRNDRKPVPKVVFSPNPTPADYVAVAICDLRRIGHTKARDMKWLFIDLAIEETDQLADLAYDSDAGKVYCVTVHGDVHVVHIPRHQRRRPVVEPLQIERAGLPFDPTTVYAPPYDRASKFTGTKRIFFFGGSLYQVWRNTTSAVSWTIPGGSRFTMAKDGIFVLKYDSGSRSCWDVVKDLGGCSVFIGKNNPVVLRADGVAGVRPNCVYWIDEWSRNEPMVLDMATGTSTLHPSAARALNPSCRPVCWYLLNGKITSIADSGRKHTSGEDCGQVFKRQKVHYS
ncbi:unnamed protein product [Urochloa humidicola]